MIFSNAVVRQVVSSRVGDFISGGWTRSSPPSPVRVDAPRLEAPSVSKLPETESKFDQRLIDEKVSGFDAPGHTTGQRQPGDSSDINTPDTPEMAQYKEKQRQQWQAQKDAEARDKLFSQPTTGRVDGKEVDSFSQSALEQNSSELVMAKANRALVPERRNIAKSAVITAAITVPLTVVGTFAANIALESIKPRINPVSALATEQTVMEGRLVDNAQKNVFLLANTLADLRSEPHVQPSVEWLSKTHEERMDYLEEMLDYLEPEFAKEAKALGIQFQPASSGAQSDDIKSRATGLESRMAAITTLMGIMKAKI